MRRLVTLLLLVPSAGILLTACLPTPPALTVDPVVTGLDHPWDVGFTPDGTMIYTERAGRISAWTGGQKRLLAAPADVVVASEAGMMGLAIDPAFATNRFIYTCLASTLGGPTKDVRVARWRVDAGYTSLTDRTDIVTGAPVNTSGQLGRHAGCRPRFGPDGYLWIGTGDAATGTVPQDPQSLGGKVLRVDRDGTAAAGNPGASFLPQIYNSGHRNVQGLAFRPSDGMAFNVEHGTDRDDEVNRLLAGGNYGWDPVPDYDESVPMTDLQKFPNAVGAVWSSGFPTIAPSGATFLSGLQWGGWNGALAVAVLKGKQLLVLFLDGQGNVTEQTKAITDQGRLRSAVQGPDGNLYLTTDNGGNADRILEVTPR